jgi:hypothetical protein
MSKSQLRKCMLGYLALGIALHLFMMARPRSKASLLISNKCTPRSSRTRRGTARLVSKQIVTRNGVGNDRIDLRAIQCAMFKQRLRNRLHNMTVLADQFGGLNGRVGQEGIDADSRAADQLRVRARLSAMKS